MIISFPVRDIKNHVERLANVEEKKINLGMNTGILCRKKSSRGCKH